MTFIPTIGGTWTAAEGILSLTAPASSWYPNGNLILTRRPIVGDFQIRGAGAGRPGPGWF